MKDNTIPEQYRGPEATNGRKEKAMLTPRVKRLREKFFDTMPQITAERLVLETEAYQKFAGDAVPIFRAKVVDYIMERMSTLIFEDELIVGTTTNAYRGANLHPEFQSSSWYISDIDDFSSRPKDPYYISPEDRETILDDFDLTNVFMAEAIDAEAAQAAQYTDDEAVLEVVRVMAGVSRDFMARAFDYAEEQSGSMLAYVRQRYNVTDEELVRLRELYLTD